MQDQIITSQTCFGGHMDVNYEASLQTLNGWLQTHMWHNFTLTFEA